MEDSIYREQIIDLYENPLNFGRLDPADFIYDNLAIQTNIIQAAYRSGGKIPGILHRRLRGGAENRQTLP